MVRDYATKSIVLVDFKDIAIALPFPRGIEVLINAKLFSNLGDFHPVGKEDGVNRIAVSWRNSASGRDFSGLKVVTRLQRATLAGLRCRAHPVAGPV